MAQKKSALSFTDLRNYFASKSYKPQTFEEICANLKARSGEKKEIKKWLKALRRNRELVRLRNKRFQFKPLPVTPAFVPSFGKLTKEKKSTRPAISQKGKRDSIPIAEHYVVGMLRKAPGGKTYVAPFGGEHKQSIYVELGGSEKQIPVETVVAAEIDWDRSSSFRTFGRIIQKLGPLQNPRIDTSIVRYRHDLPQDFPEEVLEEARTIHQKREIDLGGRKDLRHLSFITIDGADAKDHDDAVALEDDRTLWVAIADVGHFVKTNSPLDIEAAHRGNSFYFPEFVIPMFPEELSNDICSLKPNVDRLVLAARMTLTKDGRLDQIELFEGIIHSKARLTYDGVDEAFENSNSSPIPSSIQKMLREMRHLAEKVYLARIEDGGIDFDLSETRVVLNEHGEVAQMARRIRTASQRIIEEFMLLANKAVAFVLQDEGFTAPFRVHDQPDPRKLDDFFFILRSHGQVVKLKGEEAKPRQIDELLKRFSKHPSSRVFSYLALRTMSQAYYTTQNIGHYGLGFPLYVHFTSPIRRYADLIIHRLVRSYLNGKKEADTAYIPKAYQTIENVSVHVSTQERRAQLAEREIRMLKGIRFLQTKLGKTFHGTITGVIQKGFFVELADHAVEGFVHLSRLPRGYYLFNERDLSLRSPKKTFRVGDVLKIRVENADLERFRTDFSPI